MIGSNEVKSIKLSDMKNNLHFGLQRSFLASEFKPKVNIQDDDDILDPESSSAFGSEDVN